MVVRLLEKSELNSDKSPRMRPSSASESDHEAKRWKGYVDTLKRTVNSMHDICLAKQNVLGCEEALMYLSSAVRDFQSLISSINVELEWKDSCENRPVRWEVIGTTNRRKGLSTNQLNDSVPMQQRDLNESCVQCRAKRRMNSDLSDDENLKKPNGDVYDRLAYGKRANVSKPIHNDQPLSEKPEPEELRKPGCTTGKLTTPRSAMDLPQTKSSMAKIAASRQLLWQRHKKILTEKLSAKRRQEHSLATLGNRRRSLPVLAKQQITGQPSTETNLECIREIHEDYKNEIGDVDNSSTKTHAGHNFKTKSDGYALNLLDMSDDFEWRALTEEEESLAQEEESLKKEIEETESLSIDEELQRRVILDFSDVNIESDWKSVVDEWTVNGEGEDDGLAREDIVETPKLAQHSCRFRQPGELVQIHQRLLSPLRKRNLDVEEIQKRQTKAEDLRLMLQEQKSQRLKMLHSKVEYVRKKRAELLEKKRIHLENKMEKAAENRQRNLDDIIKRLKDNTRGLENSFIIAMEIEQARLVLQHKEQDREKRLVTLAEERSKQVRDRASKDAALDEKKKTAEQQKADRLKEQAVKKQERQQLIEVQKNEALKLGRKKARVYEQKLESIRTNEIIELENLRNRIQEKADRGSKKHEIVVEKIRQKAMGLNRPPGFASLADCAVPPSDLHYSSSDNICCKKCIKCNYVATSDLNLVAHLLSTEHLSARSLDLSSINFVYLKSELENIISITDGRALLDNEDLNAYPPTTIKKMGPKIKQKLENLDLGLLRSMPGGALNNNFDKKSSDLRNSIQERPRFNEQQRKKIEHSLTDLWRLFSNQKTESRSNTALHAHQSELIRSLFDFLFRMSASAFECSSKIFYRLACKVSHFLLEILASNLSVCSTMFFSDVVFNLLEWVSEQIETGNNNSDMEERSDVIISAYCLLLVMLTDSGKFIRTDLNKFLPQLNDRFQAISMYLSGSNFISYYKNAVVNGTDAIEHGFGQSVRPLSILSNLIIALSGPEGDKQIDSQTVDLHLTAIQCLVSEIYAKIRFEPAVSSDGTTASSGTLMTSSFMSTTSSNWHTNTNVEIECGALIRLWNSLFSKRTHDSSIKQKVLEIMKEEDALRFVYILIVSIHNNDKVLNSPVVSGHQLTFNPPMLSSVLDATAQFASLSLKHQIICTVGWHKSLLVQISKVPFEYFQNSSLRSHLLTALIVILFNNIEGLALVRDYIGPSWIIEFIKELMSSDPTDGCRRGFETFLPRNKWRCALQFFDQAHRS